LKVQPEGNAIVLCEGAFGTTNGKTAHGLVRKTRRYRVLSVIDSFTAGRDAGDILDGCPVGIPVLPDLAAALADSQVRGLPATHLVIGLAPDGGRLPASLRGTVIAALRAGLHVDSGLHDFLSDDAEIAAACRSGVRIRDVRKTPPRSKLHFFSGRIHEVGSLKAALLGTDSAVGKRTTAWILVDALNAAGHRAELIGTGQTAWMQGVRYGIMLDSLVNDFVTGELEHAVLSAWDNEKPEVIVIEGQGGLMNPAYPGGLEIIAACQPDCIILQHAPTRKEYDGIPGFALDPLDQQIRVLEMLARKPVIAITINHEGLTGEQIPDVCAAIEQSTGRPACDVLVGGADRLVQLLLQQMGSLIPARSASKGGLC
jgi:uncharacterized NAD-dependent epimerase/dehydratase family protein